MQVGTKNLKWSIGARWCPGDVGNPLSLEMYTPWFLVNPIFFLGRKGMVGVSGRSFGFHLYVTNEW